MAGVDDEGERWIFTRLLHGRPQRLVRMQVLKKGHQLIFTGESDPITNQPTKFSQGDIFEGPAESLDSYEARELATRLPPPADLDPALNPHLTIANKNERAIVVSPAISPAKAIATEALDKEAVARLAARALRDEKTGCLLWQGSRANGGYGQITYRRKLMSTHRLAWVAHHGPVPDGRYVCHACDNPSCVAIEHLFLGTPSENYHDMRKKGRSRFNAKLDMQQVVEIKRRLGAGEPAVAIAKDYSVRADQILKIKNGLAWREIKAA